MFGFGRFDHKDPKRPSPHRIFSRREKGARARPSKAARWWPSVSFSFRPKISIPFPDFGLIKGLRANEAKNNCQPRRSPKASPTGDAPQRAHVRAAPAEFASAPAIGLGSFISSSLRHAPCGLIAR